MSLPKTLILMMLAAASMFAQSAVTCSSDDMRRHFCSADTRGGVRMLRQRSDSACIQGRTWGYDRGGIWVDRGCRADFEVGGGNGRGYGYGRRGSRDRDDERRYGGGPAYGGGYGGGYGANAQALTCSSDDMRRHYCSADTRGGVRMLRQRSDSACIQGRTWGYDRNGIWVDRGCRADFEVGGGGGYDRRGRRY